MSVVRLLGEKMGEVLRRPEQELPKVATPVCFIGDIHGRDDLLLALWGKLRRQDGFATARIVFLGDMIDRGPNSAQVLRRVFQFCKSAPERITCLLGNHERMMLDSLTSPDLAARWLRNGGGQTLQSFGIDPGGDPLAMIQALDRILPEPIRVWMQRLPLYWQEGALVGVHAGIDPRLPIGRQLDDTLLWGHRDFLRKRRRDGIWIAHGHTIFDEPKAEHGRISVDTGAYCHGILSAAWVDKDGVSFLQANQAGLR